jgi:hypothetical protein
MIQQYLFYVYAGLGVILAFGLIPYLIHDDLSLKQHQAKMRMKYTYRIKTDE